MNENFMFVLIHTHIYIYLYLFYLRLFYICSDFLTASLIAPRPLD